MTKKVDSQTIDLIFELFGEVYIGRWVTTKRTPVIWLRLLKDLDHDTVLAACYHLVTVNTTWPPDIAAIRTQAGSLSAGELTEPSALEAWEKIRLKIGGMDVELTLIEKQALAQVGKIFDLRRSQNHTADRARFCEAFNHLIAKERTKRVTLPEVQKFADTKTPLLPESKAAPQLPVPNETDDNDDDYVPYIPDGEVKDFLTNLGLLPQEKQS